jgi:nuclear pore complex protein Nup54
MASQPSFSWSKPRDAAGFGQSTNFGQSLAQTSSQQQHMDTFSQQQQQMQQNNLSPSVVDQLVKIKEAWDPSSPNCAFQYYFYNKVPQDQAMLYTRPAGQDPDKWDKAVAARPDASSVPALAVGFGDLQKRVALQQAQVNAYRARMHEISEKLKELSTRHDLHTTVKISEMRTRHAKIVHRTLSLAVKLQVLRNRGYVLRPDEEVLKQHLERLNREIDDPAVFGRINEVWARLRVLRSRADAAHAADGGISFDWTRDEDQLDKLVRVLKGQQTGINYLCDTLTSDIETITAVEEKLRKK